MAENGSRLTTRQQKAIVALLSSRNVQEAAKSANVSQRTLYRWLGDGFFRAALFSAESDVLDQATRRLLAVQGQAVTILAEIMADIEVSASVRVRAAQVLLDCVLRFREFQNLELRLSSLEEQIYGPSR